MTPERWQQVKQALQEALLLPAAERSAFLAQIGRDDAELEREVGSLLAADEEAGSFIIEPALAKGDASSVLDRYLGTPKWAGRRVGPYQLLREIGHGGMGAVYLAIRADDEYQKQVAIKVIRSTFDSADIERRFRHERQILANLDHPNVARLIDGGSTEDGSPYFVMEYVDGLPIDAYCTTNQLSIDARLAVFRSVCAAVHYAHQHLVVHRDLKVSNILVTAEGVPKLLDFGIAKLLDADPHAASDRTLTMMRVMTLESASPEQVRGETVTTSTDIYALGVMLHRLLTGRGPYEGVTTTSHDLARAICEEDARRPSECVTDVRAARRLAGDLDTIVLKALQKAPARRYGTVEQFTDDIARHLGGRPVLARPDTIGYRANKFVTRHKRAVAGAALLVMSLVGGTIATAWQAHVAQQQRARAERRFNDVRRLANSFLFEFHDAIEHLPGSTKARELVVQRALEYLDSLSKESGRDASLERELAASYERVGDVQGLPHESNLGDTAGALRSHRTALALRQRLADAQASDPTIQRELKMTSDHLVSILAATGDTEGAGEYQRKSLAIAEMLYARNPSGVPERRSMAIAYHTAGERAAELGDWSASHDAFARESTIFEALLAGDPGGARAQRDAALACKKLGAILEKMGDKTAALSKYRRAVALDEMRVEANPNDREAKLDLSFDYASIGYTLSSAGEIAASLENYDRALAARQQVAVADPNDVYAADAVARAHVSIGRVLQGAGRLDESILQFKQAFDIAAKRYAVDPGSGGTAERLAQVLSALADAYAAQASAATNPNEVRRHWQDARASATRGLELWTARAARGPLSAINTRERADLSELAAKSDRALARRGRPTP